MQHKTVTKVLRIALLAVLAAALTRVPAAHAITGCPGDTDCDGIADASDPCPSEARNLCAAGPAQVRLNASTGLACSGPKTDCAGGSWTGDADFTPAEGSGTSSFSTTSAIGGISDIFGCADAATEDLLQCERWDAPGAPEMQYNFALPNGSYIVNLYFANIYIGTGAVGQRKIDVSIEGALALDNFDQVAAAGGDLSAVLRSAIVSVSDGNGLQIDFAHVPFEAGCVNAGGFCENTSIKAIEILVADSDGDGYAPPADCNDSDPAINPGATEVCNGIDDDCAGGVDDGNPGGGGTCATGQPGICAAGTEQCLAGSIQCVANNSPGTEACNNLDDDCDGQVDDGNPGGGGTCATGQPGICAAGTQQCQAGSIQCVATNSPGTEVCNNLDDDCDASIDEGTGGAACTTGQPGVCAAGTQQCQIGNLQCVANNSPSAEVCNSQDDDCDGQVDEGNPGGGGSCTTALPGVCATGALQCQAGNLVCQGPAPGTETCNSQDDDCDGSTDEGTGGGSCTTGNPGVCAAGTQQCQSGSLSCTQNTLPSTEVCSSSADEDCDGQVDENDCELCPAGPNTVSSTTQTKIWSLKIPGVANDDQLKGKGAFTPVGMFAPVDKPVTVRVTDPNGLVFEGTLPANKLVANGSGKSFSFSDPTGANDKITQAKFKLKGDGSVKYKVRAEGLNSGASATGTGTVTVQVGTQCYKDTNDACTLSGSGKSLKCK